MSMALEEWNGSSREALDEIELIHAKVEGTGAGRRVLTRQVNYAYAALITAHFQSYCRAIHMEATQIVVASVPDPALAGVLEDLLARNRLLDKGNPTPSNLGSDFGRFGLKFWEMVEVSDQRNKKRRRSSLSSANGATPWPMATSLESEQREVDSTQVDSGDLSRLATGGRGARWLHRQRDGGSVPNPRLPKTLVIASSRARLERKIRDQGWPVGRPAPVSDQSPGSGGPRTARRRSRARFSGSRSRG